jgi:hypothetical protein
MENTVFCIVWYVLREFHSNGRRTDDRKHRFCIVGRMCCRRCLAMGLCVTIWLRNLLSLTLKDEYEFRIFQNNMPRRISGSKRQTDRQREREEMIGWRYLQGIAAGFCQHDTGPLVCKKREEFLDQLSDYQLINKDFHPCN